MNILDRHLWERKYIDLFTIVHILTGMCFGFSIFFYHAPFLESFVTFTFFTIVWEVLEFYTNAMEAMTNQVMDVLTGMVGFLVTYTIIPILAPTLINQIAYFTLIYIIAWTFAHYGFQSFAFHTKKDMKQYKKSPSSAVALYIVIIGVIFLL